MFMLGTIASWYTPVVYLAAEIRTRERSWHTLAPPPLRAHHAVRAALMVFFCLFFFGSRPQIKGKYYAVVRMVDCIARWQEGLE